MRPSGHRGAVELVALEGGGGSGGRFDGEKWDCGCVNVSGNGKDVVVWIKYIRLNDRCAMTWAAPMSSDRGPPV